MEFNLNNLPPEIKEGLEWEAAQKGHSVEEVCKAAIWREGERAWYRKRSQPKRKPQAAGEGS